MNMVATVVAMVVAIALVPSITTGTCAPPTLDTVVVATVVVVAMVEDNTVLTAAATAWAWEDTAAAAWEDTEAAAWEDTEAAAWDTAAATVATATGGTIKHLRRCADCLVLMGLNNYLFTGLNKKCFK
jgi:hypothetical protein